MLSQRVARVWHTSPLVELTAKERRELADRVDNAESFDQLSNADRKIINQAERNYDADKAAQPDVVKVRRRAVDDALGRLAAIPDVEPGLIAVPWRTAPRPKVPTEAWAASDLRLFFIEELTATQPTLTRENVVWHLEHLGQVGEGRNANPNILAVNGVPFIYDGHHRLAALWLLGVDATNCWRLDLQTTVVSLG